MSEFDKTKEQLEKALVKLSIAKEKIFELEREPIAIIGMACRLPGNVNNPVDYWKLLIENKDGIIDVPSNRWSLDQYYDPDKDAPGKMYVKKGGFLQTPVDEFDADFFHISPKEAEDMDPQQRLALEVAVEAIQSAGINSTDLMRSLTGVYMGICFNDYGHLITESGHVEAVDNYYSTGNHYSVLSGRISYFFGLQGPAISMDTACSSSLVSIDTAVKDLRLKRCNLALAGGVNLMLAPEPTINFCKSGMLSPEGHCKTFDESADGYVRGEGCGIIVLKRLSDAIKDNNTILAVIRGTAVNQDGPSSGLTVPNGLAQEAVIKAALENAKVSPIEIQYVEAHGTGTSLGDPIEVEALKNSYTEGRDKNHPLRVGSVKTNIGHTEAVAGVASIMKVVLSLVYEKIPATLHFKKLNPKIVLDQAPLEIASQNIDWKREENTKRLAGVSAFGFSGTNAHVIIEEGPKLSEAELATLQERWLHTHPFKRQAFWADVAKPGHLKVLKSVHPLLGEMHVIPNDEILYSGELNFTALPYLKDHLVYNHWVYPGAAHLEMMLAAGLHVFGENTLLVKDVSFEMALSFPMGNSINTEVLMTPRESAYELGVFSQKDNFSWNAHSKSTVAAMSHFQEPISVDIERLKSKFTNIINIEEFYQNVYTSGLHLGEHFHTIKSIYLGEREAFGEIKLSYLAKEYLAHPALLDGCLQIIFSILRQEGENDLYLPIGFDSVELYAALGEHVYAHSQEIEASETGRSNNISIYSPSGKVLMVIKGFHVRKTSEQALKQMLVHETQVEDWFYEWNWQEKSLQATIPESIGHWLILSDGEVSDTLANLLENKGASIRKILPIDQPKSKEAFIELLKSEPFTGILHVASASASDVLNLESLKQAQTLGAKSFLHLAQALAHLAEGLKIPLFLLTNNITSTNVLQSPLNGLFKTVLLEHPGLPIKQIDLGIEWDSACLFDGLFSSNDEPILKLKKNQFFVPRLAKIKKTENELTVADKIQSNASYLITGGVGGLGLALAKFLCEKGATNLVLTGRSPLDDEIQSKINSIKLGHSKIIYESLDVGDEKAVENLLAHLEKNEKPLKGIFHLAGVLEDATLMEQDWEHFEKVFRPKVYGSFYLHQYSKDLDFFVMFSSVASILGNPGQSNYAAANAFMDALCEYRKAQGLAANSLSWGPWAEVGMAKELVDKHARGGMIGIKSSEGMKALEKALILNYPHIMLADIQWKNYLKPMIGVPSYLEAFGQEKISQNNILAKLETVESSERFGLLKTHVADLVRSVLGLSVSQAIDEKKGFFDMGFDSLMAVELKNRLQNDLGKSAILPATAIFDKPSIEKMSNYLAELLKLENLEVRKREEVHVSVQANEPIAIIGMSCRFPGGANNVNDYWDLLINGKDAITEVPPSRWDPERYYDPDPKAPGKMITKMGGFLNVDVSAFDANFFGISPREAEYLDPQQRLLLEVTEEALQSTGADPRSLEGSLTSVFIGICTSDYMDLITATGDKTLINPYLATGNMASTASGRLSYTFGFQGPNFPIDTACSSSLVAIDQACQSLRSGDANLSVAGGVNLILAPDISIDFSKAGMLAKDGHCKTFDASADGYVRGEGCGMIVLKRLSDAIRDKDLIFAVIKASSVNQDGASSALTVPNGDAQEALIRKVLSKAKLNGSDIDYVEAHGTGTALGDPIEVRALGATYGVREPTHPLKLGSVKTNIGHLEGAAGVASVIKVILALQHEILPKQLHFFKLNPNIDLNFPAEILTRNEEWRRGQRTRRAAVSSFGFSGTNAHLILEEAPALSEVELEELKNRITKIPQFKRQHYWIKGTADIIEDQIPEGDLINQLEKLPENEKAARLRSYVLDLTKSVLRLSSSEAINENKGFFDIGFDSLMAVELRDRLQIAFGESSILSSTLIFDHSNIDALVRYLGGLLAIEGLEIRSEEEALEEAKIEKNEKMREKISELSDEDAKKLLFEELNKSRNSKKDK